jgi:hypothetical protein
MFVCEPPGRQSQSSGGAPGPERALKKKTAEVLSTIGGRYMPVYEGGAGFLILSSAFPEGAPRKGDLAWGCATIRLPGEVAEWLKAAPC